MTNSNLNPGLYIVSTPIGNLDDITLRALKTLNSVDLILCENTNHSIKLLSHYDIKTKLSVYNDHSDARIRSKIVNDIKSGKTIALISDAGTPLVSDPGYKLIRELHEHGCYVTSCPGPCSPINALVLSGLPSDSFLFQGFLPLQKKDRDKRFEQINVSKATGIIFETSKKIVSTLEELLDFFGNIEIAILREMTKKFEERITGNIKNILQSYRESESKGELIILIPPQIQTDNLSDVLADIKQLKNSENSTKDIVKMICFKYTNLSKTAVYDMVTKN